MAAPVPPSDVAANSPATSTWANSVADALQLLIADLYPAGALAIDWALITGKPTMFAPSAHGHAGSGSGGLVDYSVLTGKPSTFAPGKHAHAGGSAEGQVPYANLTGAPTTMAPTAHTHAGGGTGGLVDYSVIQNTPANAAAMGGWMARNSGASAGRDIYVGPTAPSSPAPTEGDLWVEG